MDVKEEFSRLVEENSFEEARIILEKLKYDANEDPFYYANMGWILNHMERYQEAEFMLRTGINVFPNDGWMYSQLGYGLDRQKKIDDGLKMLLIALKLRFDEPWLHGEIGWCYKEKGDYQKAIEYFENGLLDDPNNVFILSQAAHVYVELNDYVTAEEYFKKSYLYQHDNDGLYDLAHFYHQSERYLDEIEQLEKISDAGENGEIQYELGNAYYELKTFDDAIYYFKNAISLGKDDTGIRSKLGDTYRALKKIVEANNHYDIALEYYEKALLHEEDTYWIYQEMIWIAHKQQDYPRKLAYLNRAKEVHEMSIWLMYHYARCYTDMEEHKLAVDACQYCIEHGENNKEILDIYAWNLGRCDQELEAIEILLKSLHKYGEDDWDYGELGWNYAQLKKYDKAKESFERAIELAPTNVQHTSMLGWCYLRIEKFRKAYLYIRKAMNMGRNDGWIHSVMGEICVGKDELDAALVNFEFALEHGYDEDWIYKEIERIKNAIQEKNNV